MAETDQYTQKQNKYVSKFEVGASVVVVVSLVTLLFGL